MQLLGILEELLIAYLVEETVLLYGKALTRVKLGLIFLHIKDCQAVFGELVV